jgi:hypothetical protein
MNEFSGEQVTSTLMSKLLWKIGQVFKLQDNRYVLAGAGLHEEFDVDTLVGKTFHVKTNGCIVIVKVSEYRISRSLAGFANLFLIVETEQGNLIEEGAEITLAE